MADRSEPSVKSIHNMKTSLIPAAENWPRGQCSSSRHRPHSAFLMATLLVVSLLAAVLGLGFHGYYSQRNDFLPIRSLSSIECPPNKVVETICKHTADADVCVRELGNYEFSSSATPLEIIIAAIQSAAKRVSESEGVANECRGESGLSKLEGECTEDCMELLVRVADLVKDASTRISSLRDSSDLTTFSSALMDVKAWLSSALSLQTACSDNFDVASGSIQIRIQSNQAYLGEVIGYVLSLIDILAEVGNNVTTWQGNLPPIYHFIRGPHHHQRRRLLSTVPFFNMEDGFPYWVSAGERRLLQDSSSSIAASANSVVAKDGSGQFLSIMDALNNIPGNYSGRYIIYIKQGVYEEVFNVTKDQKNITLVGDGIGKTIITGDRNVASGNYNTYRTSTVGVAGDGFYARDITFQNTAGPSGHQAVAMRAGADLIVFYRCSFEGYQDTLYALAGRQFYRDCTISGTVDFIFGNAIALFQNCILKARLPLPDQKNTYTAQGRKLESDVSGYSFQNCTWTGEIAISSANYTVQTFLGRPWKAFSRVVILESELQGLIDPAGWLPWNESNPFTDTLYYGEYQNRGGGSDTSRRVNWTGVHPAMTTDEASQFTLNSFIAGETWLTSLQVTYQDSL